MILPIVAYGASILKKKAAVIDTNFPNLRELIANMWETLYNANGCGLAAPQVNIPARIFLVDSKPTFNSMDSDERLKYFDGDEGITETFINAMILERSADSWEEEEGCLSIPGLSGSVKRPWEITIQYYDPDFNLITKKYAGMTARMIQHEYDHIEGRLYIEYLSPLGRRLLNGKLEKIRRGRTSCAYPLWFERRK